MSYASDRGRKALASCEKIVAVLFHGRRRKGLHGDEDRQFAQRQLGRCIVLLSLFGKSHTEIDDNTFRCLPSELLQKFSVYRFRTRPWSNFLNAFFIN